MYENLTYPANDRMWGHRQRHGVTILYTAPTLIRSLMKFGTGPLEVMTSRACRSERGRADQPKAWYPCERRREPLAVVDTWWQTETGGDHDHPSAGLTAARPGSATHPFPGIFRASTMRGAAR